MKTLKALLLLLIITLSSSCGSIKSTIKNIDDSAIKPAVRNGQFIITEYAKDNKYGYDQDYPINLGFENEKNSPKNIDYFFNGLEGPKGEKIFYVKIENCCPFPTKRSVMGAGTLEVYEVNIEGTETKLRMYLNIYEKGKVMCPKGLQIKKENNSN
jgi:hypothetical protein